MKRTEKTNKDGVTLVRCPYGGGKVTYFWYTDYKGSHNGTLIAALSISYTSTGGVHGTKVMVHADIGGGKYDENLRPLPPKEQEYWFSSMGSRDMVSQHIPELRAEALAWIKEREPRIFGVKGL